MLANYNLIKHNKDDEEVQGLLISATLTDKMVEGLKNDEQFLLLLNAMRLICNTVPDNGISCRTTLKKYFTTRCNLLQPMELLGCHCVAEFQLNNNLLIDKIEDSVNKYTQKTLIELVYEGEDNKDQILEEFRIAT